jgi:hypothetical protein
MAAELFDRGQKDYWPCALLVLLSLNNFRSGCPRFFSGTSRPTIPPKQIIRGYLELERIAFRYSRH